MPVTLEERQARGQALKEYQANITPEQRQANLAKAKETRANNNVVKQTIEKMFNKQYLVYDTSCEEGNKKRWKQVSGIEACYMELMRVVLDKETTPADKLKIVESLAKYSGNEPSQKKETTTNINMSWENLVDKLSGGNALEIESEEVDD